MTDKIVEPVTPDVTDPLPLGPLSGDWTDDDAQVYDADFEMANHGDFADAMGIPHAKPSVTPNTRLLCASAAVGAGADPVMLLPADPNRKSLSIVMLSNVAAVAFRLGSDKSDVWNGNLIYATNFPIAWELPCHTGALWAYCAAPVNAVTISVVAVTV